MPPHYLEPLFAPRSIAVVGASERIGSLGRAVIDNLIGGGFKGSIYPVNPKATSVRGTPCFARVSDLPPAVDLLVIVTPAHTVMAVLQDAAKVDIHHAVVLTAGFGETGSPGRALEAEVVRTARAHGIRLIGPNCLGIMRPAIGLNATFARGSARPGSIALISQSGAICAALTDWAWAAGIGFSSVVSMGAATDLDFGEILDFLAHDEATKSILMYVEGVHDARRFISGLRGAARTKPIVVLKVGRHAAGSRAAMSHTGALVGNDAVFDAVLRRCGVVRAGTYAELFAAAQLLGAGRRPAGNRLAILTNGGGPGVMAADCASDHKVDLATLSEVTMQSLNVSLPVHWAHANPVDIIGDASARRFADALEPLLADPGVDGVLTLFCPQIVTTAEDVAATLLSLTKEATKPVLTGWLGETHVKAGRAAMEAAGMPVFQTPEAGVIAFAALAEYGRAQKLLLEVPPPLSHNVVRDIDAAFALAVSVTASGRTLMTEPESKQLLGYFGIATPPTVIAHTLVEAIDIGEQMGYPLALKILSPDITHKSDVEGVTLNVRDLSSLEREFRNLMARVAKLRPDAHIEGVAIQPMIEKRFGRELMIGVARDAVFGQVISFGVGGVAVELLKDNAIGLPPLNARLADDLIDRTTVSKLLKVYRHIPAVDHAAVVEALLSVSEMVCALPWLAEMDINPLCADDAGIVALDARVVIDPTRLSEVAHYSHIAIHPYPERLERVERLRDGVPLAVRPIRPEDAHMELAFVECLSEHSRYMRFFNAARTLSPSLLARLTQIDYDRELALVALHRNVDGEQLIGIARYSPNADNTSCEFAVTVADDWHQRGVASVLMHGLIEAARSAGYARMTGTVLAVNTPMHALIVALGFSRQPHSDDRTTVDYFKELATLA